MNYTDADEDAEKLLSFMDEVGDEVTMYSLVQAEEAPGPDGKIKSGNAEDEWVQTHVGRGKSLMNSGL